MRGTVFCIGDWQNRQQIERITKEFWGSISAMMVTSNTQVLHRLLLYSRLTLNDSQISYVNPALWQLYLVEIEI